MKKRIVCLLMVCAMALSLVACSTSGEKKKEPKKASEIESQEDLNEFYMDTDYDVFKENGFAAVSPLCGISLDIPAESNTFWANAPEFEVGQQAFIVFINYVDSFGTVYIEYDPSFTIAGECTTEDIVVNGMDATKYTFEGDDTWYAICFKGEYEGFHIVNNRPEWFPEHEKDFFELLETLVLVKYEE